MGARKRNAAEQRKEENKAKYFASLRDCPTSPRKMRLVIDLIRGMEVNHALDVLKFSTKDASNPVEKLLKSAIANWQAKNEGVRIEDVRLVVSQAFVDQGKTLKRLRPAPQGRAHRIRKRSNHVTIFVDTVKKQEVAEEVQTN
jgi:large subunit ribosomal protein L22